MGGRLEDHFERKEFISQISDAIKDRDSPLNLLVNLVNLYLPYAALAYYNAVLTEHLI